MKTAILYTVISLLNLIGFVVGVSLLPAQVPIHFDASMTADVVGSPWVFLALPGGAALVSGGMWAALGQKKNRKITVSLLTAIGIVLAAIGWAFFALVSGGVAVGEKVNFPFLLAIDLPIALLVLWLGCVMPATEQNSVFGIRTKATLKNAELWKRTHRFGGALFFAAGSLSAVCAVLFGCVPALFPAQYVAHIVLAASLFVAAAGSLAYASAAAGKLPPLSAEEEDKNDERV